MRQRVNGANVENKGVRGLARGLLMWVPMFRPFTLARLAGLGLLIPGASIRVGVLAGSGSAQADRVGVESTGQMIVAPEGQESQETAPGSESANGICSPIRSDVREWTINRADTSIRQIVVVDGRISVVLSDAMSSRVLLSTFGVDRSTTTLVTPNHMGINPIRKGN
jgi:hypothetical protein